MNNKIIAEALTYDDVLLVPAYSEVLPRDVNTQTQLTREITLNIPIVSAAMDTVTEYQMAIAMAQEGGIGFLHKNMSIEAQCLQVRKVKRAESGMIIDPVTLPQDASVKDARTMMQENRIGGIPVVDKHNKLVGIVTNRDLRFETSDNRPVSEVMTHQNLVTVPEGISLYQAEEILRQHKIEKLPVVNAKNELKGLITYRDILNRKNRPNACKDNLGRLRVGAAVGITADVFDRIQGLEDAGVDVIGIDTAHGHSKGVLDTIKQIRKKFAYMQLMVGNIATAQGCEEIGRAHV